MNHYRGIKVVNAVPMTCNDGSPNMKMMTALNRLADRLEQTGDTLIEAYKGTSHKHKARCSKGHDILIKPNDYVSKKAGCQQCFLLKLHGHEKMIKEFNKIVKRHKLTQHEPFDFRKGVLRGLKEMYLFTCPYGQEHWLSPYKQVTAVFFQCWCGKCRSMGERRF
ncbi:hypothetical protein [Paenibacillus sp. BC26]|uniref:hypothetical protein n=1 Tax=Paenibacillus sp. BC26 TaxID=1881032 RepID=UPI0008F2F408|nr:hypothetical protein [Paenibacillus sp. BC26]SFS70057.1 hypothetical protein SAMN05428962_2363 [Paenibacillus sp. BC26]